MAEPTAQLLACFKERLSASEVQALLDAGADLHARDAEGNTPLHVAVRLPQPAVAILLIEKGADLNPLNEKRERPIDVAIHSQARFVRDMIAALLAAGADVGHLIKADVPKPLQDLFPKLPTKRTSTDVIVPGSARRGFEAWCDFMREQADERWQAELAWKRQPPLSAAAAWRQLIVDDVNGPTGWEHIGKRLREFSRAQQTQLEQRFRDRWVELGGPAEAAPGTATVDQLLARAHAGITDTGADDALHALVALRPQLTGEPAKIAARAIELLESGGDGEEIEAVIDELRRAVRV